MFKRIISITLSIVLSIGLVNISSVATKANDELVDITSSAVIKDWKNFKASMVFNGKDRMNNVKMTYNGVILNSGLDYSIEYENNFFVGTATVIYTGIGKYTGVIKRNFKIVKANVKDMSLHVEFVKKKLQISANNGSYDMEKGVDYDVSTSIDYHGNLIAKFTGKGRNYTGKATVKVKNAKTPYKPTSDYLKIPTIKKLKLIKDKKRKKLPLAMRKKTKKNKVKVTLKKLKKVTGYQIAYKKSKKWKTVDLKKKTSYTVKKLKEGKTLYVKARSYIDYNKRRHYSGWGYRYAKQI